jgi:pyridoxamine 5'-phosphate oxidase
MNDLELATLRRSYRRSELLETAIDDQPLPQLKKWLGEAHAADLPDSNAMCLSTVDERGRPSARMVLLRRLDERGLAFFTSYFSRKGREISTNPFVAATFYWASLERQIRVEGRVEPLPEDESDAYFASRPRGHQIAAWASEQSEQVEDRALLDRRMEDYAGRFEGEDVPRPHSWGGFLIRPERVEFWQGRENRMHDRLEYTRADRGWDLHRLQP